MSADQRTGGDFTAAQLERFREFWDREQAAAWLYRDLAEHADPATAKTLTGLARVEDEHAEHWAELLRAAGVEFRFERAPWRDRTLAALGRRFGVEAVLPMLVRLESADAGMYVGVPEAPEGITSEEIEIGQALAELGDGAPSSIAFREPKHRTGSGGALRAATFGINDGLVSNLALVMGVAGGTDGNEFVVLAGVAGLIAGALSMATGEWISVKSQRELYERELEIEREELRYFPDEEREELALIYEAKGISKTEAEGIAVSVMADEVTALDTLAREELGLDPGDLGSPWLAAISSFFSFGLGAIVPLLPFLLGSGTAAVIGAVVAAMVVLGLVGGAISLMTGRAAWFSALRMMLIGGAAAGATFLVGSLVGVAVA